MDIKLYLTPAPFSKADISGRTAVVIDVLRCTTSICAALQADARGVVPTAEPGEAREMWTKIGSDMAVLAGERNGVKIENFQLGNSPREFTAESVGGKLVIMTTTNGTQAFVKAHNAGVVLSCSLANISVVAERVASVKKDVAIVCAGREGHFSIEDTICGGMLIHMLTTEHRQTVTVNDAGSLALLLYRTNRTAVKQTIAQGEHGRFLSSIGFARDLEIAAAVDSIPVLPVLIDGRLVLDGD